MLIQSIPYTDPIHHFSQFASADGAVFLDSSLNTVAFGRYSFIAVDPWQILTSKNGQVTLFATSQGEEVASVQGDPFEILRGELEKYPLEVNPDPELPPFKGGVAGFFSYDLCHHLEKLPRPPRDDLDYPDMAVGFYDLVLAYDHAQQKAWGFSSGLPEQDPGLAQERAQQRMDWVLGKIEGAKSHAGGITVSGLHNPLTQEIYVPQVQRVIDYIYAGDIYQANLSRRYEGTLESDPLDLYRHLRVVNPAPFSAYLHFGECVVASASPERFLSLKGRQVETKPIKGTMRRDLSDPVRDAALARELRASEKDQAENIMIVDLMRNDLSRVCDPGSVNVPHVLEVESYATVHHLVTTVAGQLQAGLDAVDLLRATFPGGSITGTPKIRAMEIIAELEPTQRGPYCGSIGYIGFDGTLDTSIVIRTFVIKGNHLTFQVGGGIVADSDPVLEFQETETKAAALKRAAVG